MRRCSLVPIAGFRVCSDKIISIVPTRVMRFRAARYVDRIISVTSEAGRSDSKSARIRSKPKLGSYEVCQIR